jgi:hypothetical protein
MARASKWIAAVVSKPSFPCEEANVSVGRLVERRGQSTTERRKNSLSFRSFPYGYLRAPKGGGRVCTESVSVVACFLLVDDVQDVA